MPRKTPPSAGDLIKVVTERSQEAVVNVLGYSNRQSIRLTSLEIPDLNLESLFLYLTGKKLRD